MGHKAWQLLLELRIEQLPGIKELVLGPMEDPAHCPNEVLELVHHPIQLLGCCCLPLLACLLL
jgi:hypothetical protein